jgi:hypothetical protein
MTLDRAVVVRAMTWLYLEAQPKSALSWVSALPAADHCVSDCPAGSGI